MFAKEKHFSDNLIRVQHARFLLLNFTVLKQRLSNATKMNTKFLLLTKFRLNVAPFVPLLAYLILSRNIVPQNVTN